MDIDRLVDRILLKRKYDIDNDDELNAIMPDEFDEIVAPNGYEIVKYDGKQWKSVLSKTYVWNYECENDFKNNINRLMKNGYEVNTKKSYVIACNQYFIRWRNRSKDK